MVTIQLLDTARRAILSTLSSEDCFLIFPKASDIFAPSSNGRVRLRAIEAAVTNEKKSFSQWKSSQSQPRARSQSFRSISSDGDRGQRSDDDDDEYDSTAMAAYYTFEADRPDPVKVRLEVGDVETSALQNCQAMISPDTTQGGAGFGSSAASGWTIRRLSARVQLDGDGRREGVKHLHTVAVPIDLKNGLQAVITVVRRAAPYTSADKESVHWIGKVLAYCLQIRGK